VYASQREGRKDDIGRHIGGKDMTQGKEACGIDNTR
jgi:hypothetical protein